MKMRVKSSGEKKAGGRPAKFAEPRRPVTVTLPVRVLEALERVDPDRAKAIVKLAEGMGGGGGRLPKPAWLVEIGKRRGVILVGHSKRLAGLPWMRLVEVAPGRHLISVRPGTTIESMELALRDLLEEMPGGGDGEREVLEALLGIVRSKRRAKAATMEEILVVTLGGEAG